MAIEGPRLLDLHPQREAGRRLHGETIGDKDMRAVTREDIEVIVRRLDGAILAWEAHDGARGGGEVAPSTAATVWGRRSRTANDGGGSAGGRCYCAGCAAIQEPLKQDGALGLAPVERAKPAVMHISRGNMIADDVVLSQEQLVRIVSPV